MRRSECNHYTFGFGRLVLGLIVSMAPAKGVEVLSSSITAFFAQSTPGITGALFVQAVDLNSSTKIPVQFCMDDTSSACTSGKSRTTTANCALFTNSGCGSGNFAPWSPRDGNMGSADPTDGQPHTIWARALHQAAGSDIWVDYLNPTITNAKGFTFIWNAGANNFQQYDVPVVTSASPITPASTAILANSSDSYSTGTSAGNLICTVNGTPLYDNGVAGYYAFVWSIPCGNVKVCSLSVADGVTLSTFNSACNTALNAIPATAQALAVAWLFPNFIVNGSSPSFSTVYPNGAPNNQALGISGFLSFYGITNGTWPTCTFPVNKTQGVGQCSPGNPMFNDGVNGTPFSDYSYRPTWLLGAGICSSCTSSTNSNKTWTANFAAIKAVIDAAHSNVGRNPTGTATATHTTASAISYSLAIPSTQLGTVIDPKITLALTGSSASPVTPDVLQGSSVSNSLMVVHTAQIFNFDQAGSHQLNAVPGAAFWFSAGSTTGSVVTSGGGNIQTPTISALVQGGTNSGTMSGTPFAFACGTAAEPGEAIFYERDTRPDLFLAYYGAGNTIASAVYKAWPDPWIGDCYGDGLAQAYQPPFPSPTGLVFAGAGVSGGKVVQ